MRTKCIVYTRLSSVNNNYKNIISLNNQYNQCKEYADKNNFEIVKTFEEIGSAKKLYKLPILTKIVNEYHDITLLIRSVCRYSRNTRQGLEYYEKLKESNVKLIFAIDNLIINNNNPHIMNRFRNLMSESEMESAIASKRQKDSIKFRKQMGGYVGGIPYGFKLENKTGISKLVINKQEQNIISFINAARKGESNSRKLSQLMCKISKLKDKIEFIDSDGETVIERFKKKYTLTYNEISNLLNDFEVNNRGREWKASSVYRIFNKEKIKKRKIINLAKDFSEKLTSNQKKKSKKRRKKNKKII
jgi:DNA invertase Pin-like site-specific DNA recombinase